MLLSALLVSLVWQLAAAAAVEPKITASDCGQAPLGRSPYQRIVGGQEATPYSWPFICSLEYNGYHICGGTMVKNTAGVYYFVTAAHCLDRAARFYTLSCSIHDRLGSNPYKQTFTLSSYINHESYNSNTFANDISIMVLANQPTENNYFQGACIASRSYFGGETAWVMGWGTLTEGGSSPRTLQEVSKPILTDTECRSAYGSSFDSSTMMCSGLLGVGGKDACQGDSGGPMVSYRNGAWELVGVVSWGYGCARPSYPGVYADVYNLRSWINSKIN
ncbi:trypsin delta-like [Babylonia areolata]|uniref:trypsin delta-like n=1 Tax=Babylonia areolata TaxID=304850 RepID=UPI003FD3C7E7